MRQRRSGLGLAMAGMGLLFITACGGESSEAAPTSAPLTDSGTTGQDQPTDAAPTGGGLPTDATGSCHLVSPDEMAAAIGAEVDDHFGGTLEFVDFCVYEGGMRAVWIETAELSPDAYSSTIDMFVGAERQDPEPVPGLGDEATFVAGVLYMQQGNTFVTVRVDTQVQADEDPADDRRLALDVMQMVSNKLP